MILAPQQCGCPVQESVTLVGSSASCSGITLFMILLEGFLKGRCDIATPCSNPDPVDLVDDHYDFVIVGAGTAGSVVAGRLSENQSHKVLLLEAGGPEPIGARVPSFYGVFQKNAKVNWKYRTVPADYCLNENGQGCYWSRGKVIGGSSVMHGMMYSRGHAADYDDWVAAGAKGWSRQETEKYFLMTEGNKQVGKLVSGKYHSNKGPLPVQQFNYQPLFLYTILNAVNETGKPIIKDMNDPTTPEGFTVAQFTSADGQRYTSARAFLKPRSKRPNLHVKTHALVSKVLFKGKSAVGVQFIDKNGKTNTVRASKEVILSGGALNSPQILLLSGVGPKETLEKFNIPVVADLPVGQNLRNHIGVTLSFIIPKIEKTQNLDWAALTEYLLNRDGPMSSTAITQLTGLLYSNEKARARQQPDLQFFFAGFSADCSKTGVIGEPADDNPKAGTSFSAVACSLLPRSVGNVTLNSTDPRVPPIMDPNYFSHPDDIIAIKEGAKYLKKLFLETKVMKNLGVKLDTSFNKCDSSGEAWSDSWLECMSRTYTDPQNHQMSTAAIGKVVDPDLKVYNITGLRVIDASVMPTQVTGNPQAPIMMVAEKGAALIKQQWA